VGISNQVLQVCTVEHGVEEGEGEFRSVFCAKEQDGHRPYFAFVESQFHPIVKCF